MHSLSYPNKILSTIEAKERLDLVESIFQLHECSDLTRVSIICAQHILPTTYLMLQSFFDRDLSPKKVFLIGKCYSTDLCSYEKLRQAGVNVCSSSLEFNKNLPFDVLYKKNISNFIDQIFKKYEHIKNDLIIVLDDGGELIYYLNNKIGQYPYPLSVVGVEQTTSGYEKIKNLNLRMGVINVARSYAKLLVESKIVVRTAVAAILRRVQFWKRKTFNNTLILGNGAIGSALADHLEGLTNVTLVDIEPEKSDIPYEKCFKYINDFNFIIGCVGKNTLSLKEIKRLKVGTTLASLSSSDREFDIIPLRKKSSQVITCHDDFIQDGIQVLNCGFPINFNGNAGMVDIKEFALTRALLTLGVLQAMQLGNRTGLLDLSKPYQDYLLNRFFALYQNADARSKCL